MFFCMLSYLFCRERHLQEEISLLPSLALPRVLEQWNKFLRLKNNSSPDSLEDVNILGPKFKVLT